jgi:N-acetylneuraminic acid mutarotase
MKTKINRQGFVHPFSVLLAASLFALAWSTSAQGQGCPPRGTEYFDRVTAPALPTGWVASQGMNVTGAPPWVTSNVASHSWPNDAFSTAPGNILDNRLDTPVFSSDPFGPGISFQNNYNLESGRDGAVVEISSPNINGGAFTDITDPAVGGSVNPGYNSVISSAFGSPLAGRMAWSGNSGGYVLTNVFYGMNAIIPPSHVRLRFRLVSDNSNASEGWRIDTVTIFSNECPSPTPPPSACPLQPWTSAANYPLPEISENAMGATGFVGYSAGGYTSSGETNAVNRYDPGTDSWAALAPLPVALARARGVYSFSPGQGAFFVFGGVNQSMVLDTTYIYNVSTNTWSTGAPMPAPRYLPNVVYHEGRIFVIGGHDGTSETNQTWEYDPVANTWITGRANIPVAMGGSVAGVLEHSIYLVSNLNGGAGSSLHYRYDIILNTWTLMPPAPATLYQPVGGTIGRQICVVGGPDSAIAPSGPHTGSYIYDTFLGSWTTGPNTNIPHASAGGTSFTAGNRLLVVGGHNYTSGNTNVVETAFTSCVVATPTPTPTITPPPTATPTPSATVPPTPSPTPTATPAQALNISTRLRVETGDRVMIGGFIVSGSTPKRVAIRGLGPSLNNFGLSDLLADPTLELRGNDGALLAQDDDWQDDPEQAGQLTALGLALQNPNESGIVATLEPGAYTALMAGKNQTSGIGLVEIYDTDPAAASQLANISTRGFVRTGDNVMIGGFILGHGNGSANVVVRGRGPSLSQLGLNNVLTDPTLQLRDANGALLIANDNWQDDPVSAAQLTAHGLAPSNSLESGIFTALPPGLFTAILAGKAGSTGIGLVEIYNVQ